jgi:hypothetical protein
MSNIIKLKYIVSGTGRCGTVLLSKFLSSVGIKCGHESIFTPLGYEAAIKKLTRELPVENSGCLKQDTNNIVADSSFMSVPFLELEPFKDVTVIHICRNPINTINSLMNRLGYFWNNDPKICKLPELTKYQIFLYDHFELQKFENPYTRAAAYYVKCNQQIEKHKKVIFHKIEDNIELLADKLNLKKSNYFDDKKANHWGDYKSSFKISMIDNNEIKKMLIEQMKKYQYIKSFL